MEEDLLARLQSLLAYIENAENYYAGFRHVIKSCYIAFELNRLLFHKDEITNQAFIENIGRIGNAEGHAIITHGEWVIQRLEESKTKHTVRSLVSSIYSDIFGIELPKVEK